jgi:hypothetical protein
MAHVSDANSRMEPGGLLGSLYGAFANDRGLEGLCMMFTMF